MGFLKNRRDKIDQKFLLEAKVFGKYNISDEKWLSIIHRERKQKTKRMLLLGGSLFALGVVSLLFGKDALGGILFGASGVFLMVGLIMLSNIASHENPVTYLIRLPQERVPRILWCAWDAHHHWLRIDSTIKPHLIPQAMLDAGLPPEIEMIDERALSVYAEKNGFSFMADVDCWVSENVE